MTARPNVYGQWVITPRTEEAFNTLSQTCLTQLRPEKITKYILLHYPMEMSLCHIQSVDGVQKATRCTTKDGSPTRQVEVHLTGAKREHLDLGLWGRFYVVLLQRRTNEVPEVRAPQGHMSQPRELCNLQRHTRDKCLHKQTQGRTSHNGAMRKLQRKPSCVESQMPRTSETDSDRTTPGHNPTK